MLSVRKEVVLEMLKKDSRTIKQQGHEQRSVTVQVLSFPRRQTASNSLNPSPEAGPQCFSQRARLSW